MIKILFFIEHLGGGGAEKVLCNLVNEMDQNSFDITVQTIWKTDPSKFLKSGIRYRSCFDSPGKTMNMLFRIEAAAGILYPLHMKDDYDIEVAFLECGATKIVAGSSNHRGKKIAWVHCDLTQKMHDMADPQKFVRQSTSWYQKYNRIVCVSQNVKDSFDKLFGIPEKTCVLYNTVNDADIRAKAEAKLPELLKKRRLTIVAIGRLSSEKHYDMLLRVHKRLLDETILHDLWIVGEGDQRKQLEIMIAENNLGDSVRLCGFQVNPYPYMKTADLLVCSSRYEGLSTFITEGLVLGKPIVTTACSGMRELLGESEFGLITENSEDALLEGLRTMLRDASLRQQFAQRAARRGLDFSARTLTNQTEEFFLNILKE